MTAAASLEVKKIEDAVYSVVDRTCGLNLTPFEFRFDLTSRTCYRCSTRQLRALPCHHVHFFAAAFSYSTSPDSIQISVLALFHPSFTVNAVSTAFNRATLSTTMAVDTSQESRVGLPPPYRSNLSSKARRSKDRVSRQQRRVNRDNSANSTVGSRQTSRSEIPPQLTIFDDDARGAVVSTRCPYQCRKCGSTSHNVSRCDARKRIFETPDTITPGLYVVGQDPLTILGADVISL